MPAFLLPKLMALRRMRSPAGKRPSREKDMIAALIKDILPNEAEALIPLAWDIRCCKDRDHWKSVFDDPACLDKLETSLDLDDLCEIKASAQKRAARNKAIDKSRFQDVEKPSAPPVAASLAGEASQAGDAPPTWRARPLPSGDEDVDLALARGFLPPLRGVTLSKDIRRFSRWGATYPRPCPPTHTTKSWGPKTGLTVSEALRVVIRQVWHTAETGQECPIEI